MEFNAKYFSELTTRELYEIIRAREEIFLLEQNIVCRDLDRVDYDSLHCFLTEDGELIAYLRAYALDGGARIGRVHSLTHGKGHGSRLMNEALPVIREKFNTDKITVHAQKHAEGFYRNIGFIPTSDDLLEENVPHVAMELILV